MKRYLIVLFFIAAGIFVACESTNSDAESESVAGVSTLKSSDISSSETSTNGLEEIIYEAEFFAESESILRKLTRVRGLKHILRDRHCGRYHNGVAPEISVDTADTGYPIVITIDYGDSTSVSNGRIISGLITIEISAADTVDGATRTVEFADCVVDTVTVNGLYVHKTNSSDTTKLLTTTSEVNFYINDTIQYDFSSEHMREWISGIDTPLDHRDDETEVTGRATLTNYEGVTWNREITSPLLRIATCRYFVQGTIDISQDGNVVATLDYGDGDCDNVATLTTADGEETEIELSFIQGGKHNGHRSKKGKGGRH